jgi:lipoprotein signal peptidase
MRVATAAALTVGAGAALAVTDTAVKSWFRRNVVDTEPGPKLGPFTTTRYEHIAGLSEGFSADTKGQALLGAGVLTLAGGALAVAGARSHGWRGPVSAVLGGLMLGAAVSNNGELLTRGSVTDYLDVPPNPRPGSGGIVANLADVAVVGSAIAAFAIYNGPIADGILQLARHGR